MELLSHVFPFQSRESRLSVSPSVELLRSFSPSSSAKVRGQRKSTLQQVPGNVSKGQLSRAAGCHGNSVLFLAPWLTLVPLGCSIIWMRTSICSPMKELHPHIIPVNVSSRGVGEGGLITGPNVTDTPPPPPPPSFKKTNQPVPTPITSSVLLWRLAGVKSTL